MRSPLFAAVQRRGFHLEQGTLPLDPPAIPGQLAVAGDDAMTRYDHRVRIGGAGCGNRARRGRCSDASRDVGVADTCADRNLTQCTPYLSLEHSASDIENDRRPRGAKLDGVD